MDVAIAQYNAALEAQITALEQRKPHVLLRPKLHRVPGSMKPWVAKYGDLAGFGTSPAEAFEDFNVKYAKGRDDR